LRFSLLRKSLPLACVAFVFTSACTSDTDSESNLAVADADYVKAIDSKGDASAVAVFLNFEFDGEVIDGYGKPPEAIERQMLFTVGQLNGSNSVARLDTLRLSNIKTEELEDGSKKVTYHAILPVAWGSKTDVPSSYKITLPLNMMSEPFDEFFDDSKKKCTPSGHNITIGNIWYYFRPNQRGCSFSEGATFSTNAAVTLSDINTSGKYPEYDKVWEDDALKVVAVFGKYEENATSSSDSGIAGYNRFIATMKTELSILGEIETTPEVVPNSPGADTPEITFRGVLSNGKSVEVTALLIGNVEYDLGFSIYDERSSKADLIAYNGHAGLGANLRALAEMGSWVEGQYSIMFMNGCDSYAYLDNTMWEARAAVNSDDPTGTKYLDIVTNALPSYFSEMPNATNQLIRALMSPDNPKTYEQIFESIDYSEVVLVSGEQDNQYVPGAKPGEPVNETWEGLSESGTIGRGEELRFTTGVVAAGKYEFQMTGDSDADLFVRVGNEPSLTAYDCRPYRSGANESCAIELSAPTSINIMIQGFEVSTYTLEGKRQ